jgi:hypothetical protein
VSLFCPVYCFCVFCCKETLGKCKHIKYHKIK